MAESSTTNVQIRAAEEAGNRRRETPQSSYQHAEQNVIFDSTVNVGIPPFNPTHTLYVSFAGAAGATVPCGWGGEITPVGSTNPPVSVWWEGDVAEGDIFALLEIDLDAPSRTKGHWFSPILHYAVFNIQTVPSENTPWSEILTKAVTTQAYHKPGPPPGTGLHRYVFILCKQPRLYDDADFKKFANFGFFKFKWAAALQELQLTPLGIDFFVSKNPNQSCIIL